MRKTPLVGILFLAAISAHASSRKEPVYNFLKVYDLGLSPVGALINLPQVVCGTIVIRNADFRRDTLLLEVDLPKARLRYGPLQATRGEYHKLSLTNGTKLDFHWQFTGRSGVNYGTEYSHIDEARNVQLVIYVECPRGRKGCKLLCK